MLVWLLDLDEGKTVNNLTIERRNTFCQTDAF